MPSLVLDDFSGGLNLRDSPNEIAFNETPNASNWTLDERGALKWRNGCTNVVALPGVSGKKAYIFYSAALDLFLVARETAGAPNDFSLHTRPGDLSGSWTDRGAISTDVTEACAFIDFPGNPPKVVMAVGNSGVWTYNAVGPALVNDSTTVKGKAIALWQNKAWVAGATLSDANGNPSRLYYSALGDPTTWSATGQFIDVREKDASGLTALGVAAGALIVFKKRSTYRVNDSTTGSFSTLDTAAGCVNPRAVVALHGRLYAWGADGLYECDGVGGMRNVGDKLRPVYFDSATDLATVCGGVFQDRVVFAGLFGFPSVGAVQCAVEYHPGRGWICRHTFQSSGKAVSSFANKEATLYGAIADGDDLFSMFTTTPALDDGSLSTASWFTPWLLPNSGMLARLARLRVQGLIATGSSTDLNLLVYKDWTTAASETYSLNGLRAPSSSEQQLAVDLQSLGHASAFALEFRTNTGAAATAVRAVQMIDQSLQWPNPGYPKDTATDRGGGRDHSPPPGA